jgi:hypothetical protein
MKRSIIRKQFITTIFVLLLFITDSLSGSLIMSYYYSGYRSQTSIEGTIIDAITKKPVAFATVTAVGTNIGTVTNTEGSFYLTFDNELNIKEISVQHLGYKNKNVPLEFFKNKNNIIYLDAHSIPLNEVVVRPENTYELVQEIIKKIPQNYSDKAMKQMAFYRESVMRKRKYISISEAVVEVYKAPYNDNFKTDLVKLFKGRKSSNVKPQDTVVVKLKGGPKVALLIDIAKNPEVLFSDENMINYEFSLDQITNINDKQNYVINFTQIRNHNVPQFNGTLYVDINSLAITAAEFSLNLQNKTAASEIFVKRKPILMKITPIETKYIVKYKEDNGKYYFNHARGEVVFEIDWDKKIFNSRYTIMTEIASTDRTDKNVVKFPLNEQLKSTIIFEEEVPSELDPEFWGEYNIIKPEESIENAIKKYGVILKIQNN